MRYLLPDGTPLELPDGATGSDAAAAIGPGLARAALAIRSMVELRDLSRSCPRPRPTQLEILTERSGDDALELIRHDTAHVLADRDARAHPG